jgi:predicted transposase YbfD/YdcC
MKYIFMPYPFSVINIDALHCKLGRRNQNEQSLLDREYIFALDHG